jgi:cardiolipin synthase
MLLIAAQVVWLFLLLSRAVNYADWISSVLRVISVLIVLYISNKDDVPEYRMGWILIIMVTPLFGGIMYLLLGEKRPALAMRAQLERGRAIHDELLGQVGEVALELREKAPRAIGTFQYVADKGTFPFRKNTEVKYYALGERQYEDMLLELKKAEHFIFLEYFIIEEGEMWNSILEILTEKAGEGVDVRLIYDDMGCVARIPSKYCEKIEALGIKCVAFNRFVPFFSAVMNHRDHRKIMVIDGLVAFTGGVNLADEYINRKVLFGHWKDTGVRLSGEAVWNFTVMFLEMWNSFRPTDGEFDRFRPEASENTRSDGFVQPFSDSPLDGETVSLNVYHDILAQAKSYVYIFTPYLAISDELQISLCQAAKRGVDVRIVLPGIPDKKVAYRLTRTYYKSLMKAGVKIYEYTPGFLHAKSYVCDDEIAVVGTINMDYRSLYLHFECGVLMYGCSAIADIRDDALRTFEVSHEVTADDRSKGPVYNFFWLMFDSVLRVFATLF